MTGSVLSDSDVDESQLCAMEWFEKDITQSMQCGMREAVIFGDNLSRYCIIQCDWGIEYYYLIRSKSNGQYD